MARQDPVRQDEGSVGRDKAPQGSVSYGAFRCRVVGYRAVGQGKAPYALAGLGMGQVGHGKVWLDYAYQCTAPARTAVPQGAPAKANAALGSTGTDLRAVYRRRRSGGQALYGSSDLR